MSKVRVAILLQGLGVVSMSIGAGIASLSAGLIVAGVGAVLFGVSLERD